MKNNKWVLLTFALLVSMMMSCGGGDTGNPNDEGMPDSSTYSDSPMAGQPNGYAPAGSSNGDSTYKASVDSATKQDYQ